MSFLRHRNLSSPHPVRDDTAIEPWRRNLGRAVMMLVMPRPDEWWTGLPPENCPGFNVADGKLYSLPIPNLTTFSRQEVFDYFNNSWTLTELLYSSLVGDEPFYRPPYHGLRHPLIFYYVHPAALYINKLRLAGLIDSALNPYFESLFETGVDEMNWDDMSKNTIEWPTIDETMDYRRRVYSTVVSVIQAHPDLSDGHAKIGMDHPLWALFMGFEHERIHIETSSVLIRELPVNLVSRPAQWPDLASRRPETVQFPPIVGESYPANSMIAIPASNVTLGKPRDWPTFGWDNEYGSRLLELSEFITSEYLISNGEYWRFVQNGGYQSEEYWSQEGWSWRTFRNTRWPTFWVPDGPIGSHRYRLRTCFEVIPMQWNWPAIVNYHEAKAYCKWKSKNDGMAYRLITEGQHHALRQASDYANLDRSVNSVSSSPQINFDRDNLVVPEPFNVNLRNGSESPVNQPETARTCTASGEKLHDLFGNVWQWAEDHFNPLDGARVHNYYDDFSTPCYDGKHQMIMGGSFISTGDEATPWARFHFRPHFFQYAGFRIVHIPDGSDGGVVHLHKGQQDAYESEDYFNEYMVLHYGEPELQMPFDFGPTGAVSFPQRCADLVVEWCNRLSIPKSSALEIGCSTGGASFRLGESFESVIGVDLSKQFIDAAEELREKQELEYRCRIEGNLYSTHKAAISKKAAACVDFRQADACALPPEFADFDAVLIANVLCRIPSPRACLLRMAGERGLVRIGGLLVTLSPYSWSEEFTPGDVWLGGFMDDESRGRFSEDGLKQILSDSFELVDQLDIPLIIREHQRKYQYIVSQAMVWWRIH